MAITPGMKDITQDIASSYDVRAAGLGKSKDEVKEMLGSFQASHKKMSTHLRRDLAQDKAKVKSKVKAMRNGFQTSHKEMGSALRKDLAGHTQAVKVEVAEMRGKIRTSHKEMSTQLKKTLAQGVSARKPEVKSMLSDFHNSRTQTRAQLNKELADYDRGIKNEVARTRQETKADLKEARTTWQGMVRTIEAKRAEVKAPPKAEVPVAEEIEAPIAEEEIPHLEARLLAMINLHPEGIALAEVAEKFGVAPIVLGRASKSVADKGKIRKEGRLYFPVASE